MAGKTVFLVTREGLGSVAPLDAAFGLEMFDKLLHTIETMPERPEAICFYTDGVKLVRQGSHAVLGLKLLAGMGVRIVVCRTCLEHFGLMDEVAIGEIGTMKDILGLLTAARVAVTV